MIVFVCVSCLFVVVLACLFEWRCLFVCVVFFLLGGRYGCLLGCVCRGLCGLCVLVVCWGMLWLFVFVCLVPLCCWVACAVRCVFVCVFVI